MKLHLKILCAFDDEDESIFCDETEDLEKQGHTLTKVRFLKDMWKELNKAAKEGKPFDVLLADYYMPESEGNKVRYYTNKNFGPAIRAGIKCIGLFSPEFEELCHFEVIPTHCIVMMTDPNCRTITQKRDVTRLLTMLWDNYEAHTGVSQQEIREFLSGITEADCY